MNQLRKARIRLPEYGESVIIGEDLESFGSGKVTCMDSTIRTIALNLNQGCNMVRNDLTVAAYDESISRFSALEGKAILTAHALVVTSPVDYVPVSFATFYFYTRSRKLKGIADSCKQSENIELEAKRDYLLDKIEFLKGYAPEQSLLLIDGPLIGGDLYTYMIRAGDDFLSRSIIPIFVVKNSDSNLVSDYLLSGTGEYNSDLHWSHSILRKGERTSFFKYTDSYNPENSKVFTYLKAFEGSPQRIEFHWTCFEKHSTLLDKLMDAIYYLFVAQGDVRNSQVRPIVIAEMYARNIIKTLDFKAMMKTAQLVPVVNEKRFGEAS